MKAEYVLLASLGILGGAFIVDKLSGGKVAEKVKEGGESIKEFAQNISEKVKERVESIKEVEKVREVYREIPTKISEIPQAVKDKAEQVVSVVKKPLEEIKPTIPKVEVKPEEAKPLPTLYEKVEETRKRGEQAIQYYVKEYLPKASLPEKIVSPLIVGGAIITQHFTLPLTETVARLVEAPIKNINEGLKSISIFGWKPFA
jgi:gas vesicle protein